MFEPSQYLMHYSYTVFFTKYNPFDLPHKASKYTNLQMHIVLNPTQNLHSHLQAKQSAYAQNIQRRIMEHMRLSNASITR